jgi:uncharacterized membrane protein
VLVLPLSIFFNGVRHRDKRTLAYLCFAILLYFLIAVDNAFKPVARIFDYLEVALIVLMFTSATVAIRFYKPTDAQEKAND